MTAYIDENCTKVVATDTDVKLNQKVWVELKTHGLDPKTVVPVTESCWANSDPDPNSLPRLDLITYGCAAEPTVAVNGNGIGTRSYFSFNMFEFNKHPDDVYLHCQLQLCLKNNYCVPDCYNPIVYYRKRRSSGSELSAAPALISMGQIDCFYVIEID